MLIFVHRNAESASPIVAMARINSPLIASVTKMISAEEKAEDALELFLLLRTGMLKNSGLLF